ncbi:probable G-protein coupled receptor 63 [Trichomycterus rosablanca]|uniref:probable G-protein coupled receptor 63 n=1 Tax=Trichomycterus rosablanca TaxID=2290929 RepID=UPI002F34F097
MLFAITGDSSTLPSPFSAVSQSERMENVSSSFSWENSSSLVQRTLLVTSSGQEVVADLNVLSVPVQVFFGVLMVCLWVLALTGNSVVCVMVYRRAAMRSAINFLLANLALSDMMLALTTMPFNLVTMVTTRWLFGPALCRTLAALLWMFVSVGVAMLLAISMDRFLIIVRREDRLTPHRAKILISVSWVLAFFLCFPLLLGYPDPPPPLRAPQCVLGYSTGGSYLGYVLVLVLACFFLPFGVMACAFIGILGSIRHNALRIRCDSAPCSALSKPRPLQPSVDVGFKTRAFFTILLLFGLALCSLAPLVVLSVCAAFSSSLYYSTGFFELSAWFLSLCFLRPALNPLVYYCRIRKFRRVCSRWVANLCRLRPTLSGHAHHRSRPSDVYVCADHRSSF